MIQRWPQSLEVTLQHTLAESGGNNKEVRWDEKRAGVSDKWKTTDAERNSCCLGPRMLKDFNISQK